MAAVLVVATAKQGSITSQLDTMLQLLPMPTDQVLVDGNNVSCTLRSRLMQMTITDNRGFSADTSQSPSITAMASWPCPTVEPESAGKTAS